MTEKYAVIGNPVDHSLSPTIHKLFAEQTQQDIDYQKILIEPEQLFQKIKQMQQEGFKGLNVTVPFKEKVVEICDGLSEAALAAKAVNTMSFGVDGHIKGDNTDGVGLIQDIRTNLNYSLNNKDILLIGAGGATRGILKPILDCAPKSLTITNRTLSKAQALAKAYHPSILVRGFNELSDKYDCIINATSMGLESVGFSLDGKIIKPTSLCYDLVYAKETAFMIWGKENHAGFVTDGLGMLVEQAAESFYIWRKVRPDTKNVLAKLRMSLAQ